MDVDQVQRIVADQITHFNKYKKCLSIHNWQAFFFAFEKEIISLCLVKSNEMWYSKF